MQNVQWTLRGIPKKVIIQVQELNHETGFTLGQIVTESIRKGLPFAIDSLRSDAGVERTPKQEMLAELAQLRLELDRIRTLLATLLEA
jgi:hypothetical protein